MSLSPPKFIQMLRRRDQDDLLARLRGLADKWDAAAKTQGADYDLHSLQLREVLDSPAVE